MTSDRQPVTIDAATASDEERRRFSQVLAESRERREELETAAIEKVATAREARFAYDLTMVFREAMWFVNGSGFANGGCLRDQAEPRSTAMLELVNAIRARQNGADPPKREGDPEPGVESDARPADDGCLGHPDR